MASYMCITLTVTKYWKYNLLLNLNITRSFIFVIQNDIFNFTGSVLYPDKTPLPESTSRNSYKGKYVPPLDTAKAAAAATNIVIEGK